jgi:Flp pilus assembly protein TadG
MVRSASDGLRRPAEGGRGQSLVEFALVLPLFLLLVAGVIDFGLGLNASITVTNAAREGARLGVVKPYSDQVIARARDMTAGLDATQLSVTAGCSRSGALGACTLGTGTTKGTATTGDTVVVTVTYNYRMIWPLAFGNTITLSQVSSFRVE